MNGGYLMIDFKNINITATQIRIPGIEYKTIKSCNKPIVCYNLNSVLGYSISSSTFSVSKSNQSNDTIILYVGPLSNGLLVINIRENDMIFGQVLTPTASTLSTTEVIGNASITDSNISK